MAARIEDYAVIGDTHTAALVSRTGSIEWLCVPRFDSPACFAALLGDEGNGHWAIRPAGEITAVRRRYLPGSLVLETEFDTADGTIRLIDVMPPRDERCDIVRRVEGVRGEVRARLEWIIRFHYGRVKPWVRRHTDPDGQPVLTAIAGPDALCLRGRMLPRAVDHRHAGEFTVRAGDHWDFSLTWYPSHEAMPPAYDTDAAFAGADAYWREWAARCTYEGPYHDAVVRSLVTLKALTYAPTGGLVAAATTSLPEQFGGPRNWDYRFCWLRDAALTLSALLDCGYKEEAGAWLGWLLRAIAGDPEDVQIMYGVRGERWLQEYELDWLPGYQQARPVRVGNGAYTQFQSEIFGEVMDTLHRARRAGIGDDAVAWPLQRALMGHLERVWRRPDQGIWESRGEPRDYTHSRAMIWVAFDRAVNACEEFGLDGPVERWRRLREEVREEVLTQGFNARLGSFTQYYGGTTVDAALLALPSFGFLPVEDERMAGTLRLIEKTLDHKGLLLRYDTAAVGADGLPPGEATFLPCSFWLAACYARAGRFDDARRLLDRLIELSNDVGLYSEEYDPASGRMAGNMPQALTHLALVEAACAYADGVRKAKEN